MKVAGQFKADPKKCTACGELKPRSAFYRHSKAKNGVHSNCIECENGKTTTRIKNNPGALKKINRRAKLKSAYGITPEQFDAMLKQQGGECAICNTKTPAGPWKVFHVDHCHRSGKVRGLLCALCNIGLGAFHDDAGKMLKAVGYLLKGE